MRQLDIIGMGHALGETIISNHDFEAIMDTSDEWITSRTGISKRTLSTTKNTSDLACEAAQMALTDANLDPSAIDCIIVATMTPDNITPATAPIVQAKLGMNGQQCLAFDVNGACTGFIYALQIASSMISANQVNNVLVIGAETFSKIMDYTDRSTAILFGDGAGAIVLSKGKSDFTFYTRSQGDVTNQLYAKGLDLRGGLINATQQVGYLQMKGSEVFRFATKAINDAIRRVATLSDLPLADIDLIIPHQANARIINYASKELDIYLDKFYTNLKDVGNTSAASIPIALSQAKQERVLTNQKQLVLVGFGAGLTWGAVHINQGATHEITQ